MDLKLLACGSWKLHFIIFVILIALKAPLHVSVLLHSSLYIFLGGWETIYVSLYTLRRNLRFIFLAVRLKIVLRRLIASGDLVPDIFDRVANERPTAPAFLFEESVWTFKDLSAFSCRAGQALVTDGLRPGSVVAMLLPSRPEFVGLWLGAVRAGLIPALVGPQLRSKSLLHCITSARAVALIFASDFAPAIAELQDELKEAGVLLLSAGSPPAVSIDSVRDLDSLMSKQEDHWVLNRPPRVDITSPMLLLYTSGTTGLPKPAVVPHLRFFLAAWVPRFAFNITTNDIVYTPLPLHHAAGGMMALGQSILFGSTLAFRQRFSASLFWDDCVRFQATIVQYIGETCRYLLARPTSPVERSHRVRLAFGNGLRPYLWSDFQTRFNIPIIGEFYAATESNANLINIDGKVGAVGFMLPLISSTRLVRVDPETGELIRDASSGLCVPCRAGEPGMMVGRIFQNDPICKFYGYLDSRDNEKKIVRDVFTKGDSAFLTGDLLVTDRYNYVYFIDRTGDTFRWRGENVSTLEVEAAVLRSAPVVACAVYGVVVPGCEGRAGMAALELAGDKFDMSRFEAALRVQLPTFSRPQFLRLTHGLDLTDTFKVKKQKMAKEGFDPTLVRDKLFYFSRSEDKYLPLTSAVFADIKAERISF